MIPRRKPSSRFLLLTLTILLLINLSAFVASTELDEDEEIDELLAIDEQEDEEGSADQHHHVEQQKEAEVLTKAQRIVLELNSDSSNRVISENDFVLVLGYAPWDTRSAEIMPQFAEAANKLKELGSPIVMAKLDAERYPKAASALQIRGFPTLLLFINGTSQAYTGGFTGALVVKNLLKSLIFTKKTGDPVIRVNSVAEAEKFLETYHIYVLGLFDKFEGSDYEGFVKAAISDNGIQFVEVGDHGVAKVLFPDIKLTSNFVGLVKSEAERFTTYEGVFEMDKILEFLAYNKFPLVTRLTELNSASVYSSPIKLQVMVFGRDNDFERLIEPLQQVARKLKSKDFCLGLLHGSYPPYYKSQPVPDNKNATVQVVVGKTFDELVLSSPKKILLEIFTPWCINCETTSKQVEKLAKHFKGSDSLVVARIDASANEHPKLQVADYPTLLLYPEDDKANPIKLSTKSSGKDLAATINKHLKSKVSKDEL
ncbi:unnamed protein product [Linum tenue]|uniref:protein disulfide-isomerase n=1 Tax=Linum tenue TaxID=586396 RepID=A0AAV0PUM9_9ROSI|nr:unnamed protein product [Linum tenue]